MGKQQSTPLKFSPYNGEEISTVNPAEEWRRAGIRWGFNPWTGAKRDMRDVESDRSGLLIIPPGEPVYADDDYEQRCPDCGMQFLLYNPDCNRHRHFKDEHTDAMHARLVKQCFESDPTNRALDAQVGGGHYKDMKIQPVEYIHANSIPFIEGCVIKYVSRWRAKGGVEDVKKARHFLDLLIELEGKK